VFRYSEIRNKLLPVRKCGLSFLSQGLFKKINYLAE
ncbi:MAG: hypothetical protein RLZZ528_2334, partial [Pseudomonadota bacterium]